MEATEKVEEEKRRRWKNDECEMKLVDLAQNYENLKTVVKMKKR